MFKKIALSIIVLTTLSFSSATAQKYISFGPVVGFGHSGLSTGTIMEYFNVQSKFNPSLNVGLSLIYAKQEHWGFGGEILFSKEGFQKNAIEHESTEGYAETHSIDYIRIPLKLYYFFGQHKQKIRPKIYVGPSIGFKIWEDQKVEPINGFPLYLIELTTNPGFKTIDLGIQAGMGVNIAITRAMWLNLDLNYYQGLFDAIGDYDDYKSGYNRNQNLRFQVGFLFGLGKTSKK